ncbi:AAA family ATPase [Deinococcus multiflagellatus]|uniref:AAA family ATPase n=1 Tax=Deinococcus multiflagellatus TaxID=1656887 RepID=A0ABW1ZK42_9DEIO
MQEAARHGFPRLTVLCGPSGSGKSTLAAEFPDAEVISLDDLRAQLGGGRHGAKHGAWVGGQVMQAAREALRAGLRRGPMWSGTPPACGAVAARRCWAWAAITAP